MPPYAGPLPPTRSGDVVETLRLLAYLVLALVLIVLDHRGGWLRQARTQAEALMQPIRLVAGFPGRAVERLADDAGTLGQLQAENARLRRVLLVNQARMARMQTVAADNARLRALLVAAQRDRLDVQLAPVLDVDLDPTRQRLVLAAGAGEGVRVGQTVLDAGGLVGQVIESGPLQATVLLLTDPSHAVPVEVVRTGVRLVAYGDGRNDTLRLPTVPTSSDVRVGDVLVTSGLGGRFAAGFAVGTITALAPDDSRAFLMGAVRPAARFDRGREVLLLRAGAPARTLRPVAASATLPPGAAGPSTSTAATPASTDARGAAGAASMPSRTMATPPAGAPASQGIPSPMPSTPPSKPPAIAPNEATR